MIPAAASSRAQTPSALPVVEPADAAGLASALAEARAAGKAVLPRGGGTKTDWGNPPRAADMILSTRKLNRVLEHAAGDLTATVEAGCTITALQRALTAGGQQLAIDPLWPDQATVGGVLATNDNGSLRGAYGSLRDLIIGMTVALADGTLARSGGKVVKNVAGYDLPKLMVGAFGTLGVITQATFRLHPLPQMTRTLCFLSAMETFQELVQAMIACTGLVAAVEFELDRREKPAALVRVEGPAAVAIEAKVKQVSNAAFDAGAESSDCPGASGAARQSLHDRARTGLVCRVSVLPSNIPDLCACLTQLPSGTVKDGRCVVDMAGVGVLRLDFASPRAVAETLHQLRRALQPAGGTVVVLRCPDEVRGQIDAWGDAGDALPLMRRVKEQFDPTAVLNPGRFVGGI